MIVRKIHEDDIGTELKFTVMENDIIKDVSSCVVKKLKIRAPDDTIASKDMVFDTDGSDGVLKYVLLADDINQSGSYGFQVYIELGTWKGHATRIDETVGDIIEV